MDNSELSAWAKKGYVEKDGKLVRASSLVVKKPEKFEHCLIYQDEHIRIELPPKEANRKIKNATKVEADGVKFDSRLEKTMYDLLKGAGIEFEFQKVYTLQEKFRYGTEAIRAITCRVDFYIPSKTLLIDSKGYSNDVSPLKYKMLKKLLYDHFEAGYYNLLPKIEMPRTKKECELLLNRILYEANTNN